MMILIFIVLLIIALPVIITLLPLILPLGFILFLNGVHPGNVSPELATTGLPFSQWFWADPGMSMFMLACPLLVAASWSYAWWRWPNTRP